MDNEDSPHLKKIKLLKPHIKIVRIFCGGMNSPQELALILAMDDFIRRGLITVETMYVNETKKEKMTIVCVINWLLYHISIY
jgi:hypothetical protein